MKNGFTLIELMIVVVIIGIFASVALPLLAGQKFSTPSTQCIGGYKFTKYYDRNPVQIIDRSGHGIPCDE